MVASGGAGGLEFLSGIPTATQKELYSVVRRPFPRQYLLHGWDSMTTAIEMRDRSVGSLGGRRGDLRAVGWIVR